MRSVRFIHTSDIHLDTSFSASGFPSQLGHRKREAIRATLRRILKEAHEQEVDLVLIGGDLFEHDRVTQDTVEFLKQQFEGLGDIPVFISPGNHDPYIAASPYCEETWPDNVRIFREEQFACVELRDLGIRIAGFGFNRTRVPEHPFLNLEPLPSDGFNLVLAHGSDSTRVPPGKAQHAPFTVDEIAGKNIGYCGLGHYHQQRSVPNPIDGTVIWYSGIPEGRGWDEAGDCGYLLGEIDGGTVTVKSRVCNQHPLRTLPIDCEGFSSREQIVDAILRQQGSVWDERTILRVCLSGPLDPRLDLSFEEMEPRVTEKVLHIQWVDETQPGLDFDALSRQNTLCGSFVRLLNRQIEAAGPEDREMYERARIYGASALLGQKIRIR